MIGVVGRLSWCEGYVDAFDSVEVTSVGDLDRCLDQLTARAVALGTPFNVALAGNDGTSLEIVVGARVATVQWIRDELWSCLVSLVGDGGGNGDPIEFAGNGQYSELPQRYWIEIAAARAVVRHYFQTGQLSAMARWEQF